MAFIKQLLGGIGLLIGLISFLVIIINLWIIGTGSLQMEEVRQIDREKWEGVPILVLGAGLQDQSTPSLVLSLRLDKAYEASQVLNGSDLLMSGDHLRDSYNEVSAMKGYLVDKGIESKRIYLDHLGLSTYESLYRWKYVFNQDKVIIVTQGYHLSRALFIARKLGIEAIGIPAEETSSTRVNREVREIAARMKEFSSLTFGWPKQIAYTALPVDFSQSGDVTDNLGSLDEYQEISE